ncbi:MAG: pitrilysin family protein [Kiritimatiellae bacterium]|nr:pitrilysin family protein [Kiritimatiellia bacterium]
MSYASVSRAFALRCLFDKAGFPLAALVASAGLVAASDSLDIAYRMEVLDNGLTVIVHEDRKAPIVAVNVWYHVGAKDERLGLFGFAHLFEHLMFNGSENFNDDWFKAMEKVGATDMNGTTSHDRTNYFQVVPRDALDFALWMESDRMGHFIGALTQERLDEQRGVVLNEKRQHENQPYSMAWRLITQHTWPSGHPYAWEVIGTEQDLIGATLEDAREWFQTHYGAANAVVVIAGDVCADEALSKAQRYFGSVPSGPPLPRHAAYVAKMSGLRRMVAQDRVPNARLYKVWNVPQYGTIEGTMLNVAARILADGKSSRLYKCLVHDSRLATEVTVWAGLREIAGQFLITVTASDGVALSDIEQAVDAEMARFMSEGPTAAELRRAKAGIESDFIKGCERVGGFGGKSDVLAQNFVFTGDPAHYKIALGQVRDATRTQVRDVARQWLADGQFVLEFEPFPEYRVSKSDVDRSALPVPALKPEARLPEIHRRVLGNGLRVVVAERHEVPVVQVEMLVKTGYADDPAGASGLAGFTVDMLDEGTRRRSALQISEALEELGVRLGMGCRADTVSVSLNVLKPRLAEALEIFADVMLNPAFRADDMERIRSQRITQIKRENSEPNNIAMRVLPKLLYGDRHPYGKPFSGSGRERDVAGLKTESLKNFYEQWFKPGNSTLLLVGDVDADKLLPMLERHFGAWEAGDVPGRAASIPDGVAERSVVYLVDRPGAPQAVVCAAALAAPRNHRQEYAVEVANSILGGSFTSRINMNLREDKNWSYGVRTSLADMPGERAFLCLAPVQTDKAAEALIELKRDFKGFTSDRPPAKQELDKAVADLTLRLPGRWETVRAVANTLSELERYGLPETYYRDYVESMQALKIEDLEKAAEFARVDRMVWLVVGDRAKVELSFRKVSAGDILVLETDVYGEAEKP